VIGLPRCESTGFSESAQWHVPRSLPLWPGPSSSKELAGDSGISIARYVRSRVRDLRSRHSRPMVRATRGRGIALAAGACGPTSLVAGDSLWSRVIAPPPPNVRTLAWSALGIWLFAPLGMVGSHKQIASTKISAGSESRRPANRVVIARRNANARPGNLANNFSRDSTQNESSAFPRHHDSRSSASCSAAGRFRRLWARQKGGTTSSPHDRFRAPRSRARFAATR